MKKNIKLFESPDKKKQNIISILVLPFHLNNNQNFKFIWAYNNKYFIAYNDFEIRCFYIFSNIQNELFWYKGSIIHPCWSPSSKYFAFVDTSTPNYLVICHYDSKKDKFLIQSKLSLQTQFIYMSFLENQNIFLRMLDQNGFVYETAFADPKIYKIGSFPNENFLNSSFHLISPDLFLVVHSNEISLFSFSTSTKLKSLSCSNSMFLLSTSEYICINLSSKILILDYELKIIHQFFVPQSEKPIFGAYYSWNDRMFVFTQKTLFVFSLNDHALLFSTLFEIDSLGFYSMNPLFPFLYTNHKIFCFLDKENSIKFKNSLQFGQFLSQKDTSYYLSIKSNNQDSPQYVVEWEKKMISHFPYSSFYIFLYKETIFIALKNYFEIRTIHGDLIHNIPLPGKVVAMATSLRRIAVQTIGEDAENHISIFDITRRTFRLISIISFSYRILNPNEHLFNLQELSISANGISAISGFYYNTDTNCWVPSSKIFFLKNNYQKVIDFGKAIVKQHFWDPKIDRFFGVQFGTEFVLYLVSDELDLIEIKKIEGICVTHIEIPRIYIQNSEPFLISHFSIFDQASCLIQQILTEFFLYNKINKFSLAFQNLNTISSQADLKIIYRFFIEQNWLNLIPITYQEKFSFINNVKPSAFNFSNEINPACQISRLQSKNNPNSVDFNMKMASLFNKEKNQQRINKKLEEDHLFIQALHENNHKILLNAVNSKPTPRLTFWLARTHESEDQKFEAIEQYHHIGANSEIVRILCCQKQYGLAEKIAKINKQKWCLCFIAKSLLKKDFQKAFEIFSSLHYYDPLFKNALTSNSLSFHFSPYDCSTQFCYSSKIHELLEAKDDYLTSVQLWQKVKKFQNALSICFEHCLSDKILDIAFSIISDQKTSSRDLVLDQIVKYFTDQKDWAKIATVYLMQTKYLQCYDIITEHKDISIDMSLFSEELSNKSDPIIAKICESQKDYKTAAKIHFRLYKNIDALKDIILSQDINLMLETAIKIGSNEAFILTANYLASKDQTTLIFNIISSFYKKAHDYRGLLDLLFKTAKEAASSKYRRYLQSKEYILQAMKVSAFIPESRKIYDQLSYELWLIKTLIEMQQCIGCDDQRIDHFICDILTSISQSQFINQADIYAMYVEHYLLLGQFEQAHSKMKIMEGLNADLTEYFDEDTVQRVYRMVHDLYHPSQDEIADPDLFILPEKFPSDINGFSFSI